jgi:hypothetical protein
MPARASVGRVRGRSAPGVEDEAADEYGKPVEFFRRTFLTDGLRDLLVNAVRRCSEEGGDPVIELQTNFGGGKTHSMIALSQRAAGYSPRDLPGVDAILADAGLDAPRPAGSTVLVGQWIDTRRADRGRSRRHAPRTVGTSTLVIVVAGSRGRASCAQAFSVVAHTVPARPRLT